MSQRVTHVAELAERLVRAGRAALVAESGAGRTRAALLAAEVCRTTAVLAIGKAAGAMAAGAVQAMGDGVRGLVVTKDAPAPGEGLPPGLRVLVAGHPRPDERSAAATREALALVGALEPGDDLLVLLSGGASALVGGPIDGVTLAASAALGDRLLAGGFPIEEINRVRRRLGAALGGRLAAATRARVRALVLSDVASDDPRIVGSGPLSAPPLDDDVEAARVAAAAGAAPALIEAVRRAAPSPAELARCADRVTLEVLAGPRALLAAAARALAAEGFAVVADAGLAAGPVEALADRLVAIAEALPRGTAHAIVGEPTVRVLGAGRGGRAQHLAALAARRIAALGDRALLALASDGSDGPTDAAGAVIGAIDEARAGALATAARAFDTHDALAAAGALVRTGPTGTNLTDLYVVARA